MESAFWSCSLRRLISPCLRLITASVPCGASVCLFNLQLPNEIWRNYGRTPPDYFPLCLLLCVTFLTTSVTTCGWCFSITSISTMSLSLILWGDSCLTTFNTWGGSWWDVVMCSSTITVFSAWCTGFLWWSDFLVLRSLKSVPWILKLLSLRMLWRSRFAEWGSWCFLLVFCLYICSLKTEGFSCYNSGTLSSWCSVISDTTCDSFLTWCLGGTTWCLGETTRCLGGETSWCCFLGRWFLGVYLRDFLLLCFECFVIFSEKVP